MSEPTPEKNHSFPWKWMVGTSLLFLGIVVAFFGILLQHGKGKFDEGYKVGLGDAVEYDRRLKEKDTEISRYSQIVKIKDIESDSLQHVIAGLQEIIKSKVVVSDTVIYENDGIALFDGYVTIFCHEILTDLPYPPGPQADLVGCILEEGKEDKYISIDQFVGHQTSFQFKGNKYLLVILGCKNYDGRPGVKIAIYKD
jgi:hypothetical protein